MRIALPVALVLLALATPSFTLGATPASLASPAVPAPALELPAALFHGFSPAASSCSRDSGATLRPAALFNLPAAGTGASATYDISELEENTAVNATIIAPKGASLGTNQYLLLGVGDPLSGDNFTAIGVAETSEIVTIAAPAAYLPNGTEVYSISHTVSQGSTNTVEIDHVHGYWWSYTYNGNALTGSSNWENGTYNLGVAKAAGGLCEAGYTVGPTFLAAAYGASGAATPSIPTTDVPWAVGVEPAGSSSISYVPAAANAIPQLNASLGVVGIEGPLQDSSLGIDHLIVGSSVHYAGALASLWGKFKVLALNTSTLAPVSASLAYGGKQIFNTTALDENGNFLPGATYSWQISPSTLGTLNTTTGTTAQLTAGSSTVNGVLWMNVSYNCSEIRDRANISVTPTGGPSVESFMAAPSGLVLGGNEYLNVTPGAWPRPITYQYAGLPSGCATKNTTALVCVPSAAGKFNVKVFLNDSKGHTSNATATFSVYGPLSIVSFTASPSTVTVNTSTVFAVSVTGGAPPLTYDYTGLPPGPGCSDGLQPSSFSCLPNATGTFTPTVFVNDSAGHAAMAHATITVNVDVSISLFSVSPSIIPFGGTTFLNVTAKGGTPPYAYVYSDLPHGCTTSSVASLRCTATQSGSFLVHVNVTDASGANASGGADLTVKPAPPTISAFTASPNPIQAGWTTFLNVTAAGEGPLNYAYTDLPLGCSNDNVSSLSCTPTATGTSTVTATVKSPDGLTASSTVSLTVKASTSGGPTITSFTATPSSVAVGSTTVLAVVASGGSPPLAYAYAGLPAGCTSANTATLSCVPSATGTFTVVVWANDSSARFAESSVSLAVTPAGSAGAPEIWTFSADPATITQGQTTLFSVRATGGTGTLSYTFTGLPAGCATSSTTNLTCVPSASGSFQVRVFVNDTAGHSSSALTLLTVNPSSNGGQGGSSPLSGSLLYILIAAIVAVVAVAAVVLLLHRKRKDVVAPTGATTPPPVWEEPPPPPPGGPGGFPPTEP